MTGHWKRQNKKENGGNLEESLGKEIEIWACVEKRRRVIGIEKSKGRGGEEGLRRGGWTLTFEALSIIVSASLLQSESSNSSAPSNKNCPLEKKQNECGYIYRLDAAM